MTDFKLIKAEISDFDRIFAEIENNFIYEERRDREDALRLFENGDYTIYLIHRQSECVGFITIWELSLFAFAEHFVIFEKHRNRGYGKAALDLLKEKFSRIVLEAEPPEDELKARRLNFYKRSGFYQNDFPYSQPPYRNDGKFVDLVIMSYPEKLYYAEYTIDEIYKTVYHKEYFD